MYIDPNKENSKESPKLVIMFEYQNIKIFLQKAMFQICLQKFLWLQKLKIVCRGHILPVILTGKKLMEYFTKENCKKQIKKEFRAWKKLKEKTINYMSNVKVMMTHLIVGLIKKT